MMEMGSVIAGECDAKAGMHLGLDIMVEVIDPDTGMVLPDGQIGELVFTTLARKASPLIRSRSGDIACLIPPSPCPCGQIPTRRICRIQGRTDDMIQLGTGENFFPSLLDQVMIDVPGVTGFQMIVTKNGYQDHLALKVECESPSPGLPELILQRLYSVAPSIAADVFQSLTIAEPVIEQVSPGTLHTVNPTKIRRIIDLRAK
jgi:phenylacetate-CoA ligase